jgi:transposase
LCRLKRGNFRRYLVGFVHPASGHTVFHLATTVSVPLFEAELAGFAQQVGASPHKQIVLVLDGAGWHSSVRLRVPEHVHLLFLPPHSPELQPAEHLWPLTNTVLANQHFATIEELEDAQAERCVALQAQPDLIRRATRFHWWRKPHQETTRTETRCSNVSQQYRWTLAYFGSTVAISEAQATADTTSRPADKIVTHQCATINETVSYYGTSLRKIIVGW